MSTPEERIAGLEARTSALETRVDETGKLTESVHKLAISLERLTGRVGLLEENRKSHARGWEIVLAALASGVIGILLAKIQF